MKKIGELVSFLIGLNLVAAEQIASYIETAKLKPSGKVNGILNDGACVICRQEYTAIIDIEHYPHATYSPALLFAHISAWLIDNDTDRYDLENAKPDIIVDVLDDYTADVAININFVEDVLIEESPLGEILLAGKKWSLAL